MMHHPNMHHQPMSGHPPQHMGGHQGMPGHHQMQPHQLHRENRHVTLTRVPLGPSGGGMGGHGQMGMGAMGVPPPHHAPSQRPPHPIRAMPHHPQQHHSMPPQQMKQIRRGYGVGYGPAGVLPYAHPPLQPPPAPIPVTATPAIAKEPAAVTPGAEAEAVAGAEAEEPRAAGDEAHPPPAQANSKEKTPMCLVNELARYNKIKHQYRLTSETGPAHKKVFTVTLRLGDTEEYTAEGSSIKRAQHSAASAALGATHFPPPPPRAQPPHQPPHPHQRHSGAVMPTVELNALAMKLCQPAIYTSIPAVAAPAPAVRARARPPYRVPPFVPGPYRVLGPSLLYRVRVTVGDRAWLGEGGTPQAARHDAAARALHELRPAPDQPAPQPPSAAPPTSQANVTNGDAASDIMNSEVKSPVSLVHELALKRNLTVQFTVKSERGPPHMRVFITACTVGEMETEGEGNGKKVSKRRAAERMLDEMRRRWPPALLRARAHERRRPPPAKKKPRNLIKEGSGSAAEAGGADNPISRLAQARHSARARSPQYVVLEERGAARRREFLVQCDAPPHRATGLGPNKKTAKRRAAHNVLLAMEMNGGTEGTPGAVSADSPTSDTNTTADGKRKDGSGSTSASDARQPVPGVLLMDYRSPHKSNGVSETNATSAGNSSPGAKDQLMYLSQLLGFTVQFSDFPKRNHGEYLSLVSLSTEPPVMCHGGGPSTQHSHEQCARAALRALALMGLDVPNTHTPNIPTASALSGVGSSTPLGVGAASAAVAE